MNASTTKAKSAVKYSKEFEIPADFPEVLRDLTREVLRENPSDVNKFGTYNSTFHSIWSSIHPWWLVTLTCWIFSLFENDFVTCSNGIFCEENCRKRTSWCRSDRKVIILLLLLCLFLSVSRNIRWLLYRKPILYYYYVPQQYWPDISYYQIVYILC